MTIDEKCSEPHQLVLPFMPNAEYLNMAPIKLTKEEREAFFKKLNDTEVQFEEYRKKQRPSWEDMNKRYGVLAHSN